MNCKNCQNPLEEIAQFCNNCGAKIVIERITFKKLFLEVFINVLGFDSKFFTTLREMITKPHVVISDYLNGVRKRYMNPFGFLAVGAALSLLIFNYYADDFITINSNANSEQFEVYKQQANMEIPEDLSKKETQRLEIQKKTAQLQLKFLDGMMQFMLHYYNLLAFVFLFLYAILSKWTFWKPHNFGEHIVINAYVYGFTIYISIIAFFLAMLINPSIYIYSSVIYVLFYMYTFGKFYKLSLWQNILRLLKFLLGLIVIFIIGGITIAVLGFILGRFGLIKI